MAGKKKSAKKLAKKSKKGAASKSRKPAKPVGKGFRPVKRVPLPRVKPVAKKPPTKADFKRQEKASDKLRFSLKGAAAELATEHGVETTVAIHENRDGTIDGELRIFNIPRSVATQKLLIHMETALWDRGQSPHRLPREFWLSVGGLTDWGTRQEYEDEYRRLLKAGLDRHHAAEAAKKARSPLPRYKGLGRVGMYPQRATDTHVNFINARKKLFGPQQHKRRRPEQMLVRVYWNPQGKRPGKR